MTYPISKPRLRIVDDEPGPVQRANGRDVGKDINVAVTPEQAAAFAALIADGDQVAVSHTLEQMGAEQVRSLAIALATQINAAESASGEVSDVVSDAGPDGICTIAVAAAAQAFGTTGDATLSADRHRAVTDARAVAMTAARRGGMTLTSIAAFFGKDHTSVMYAQSKVANNPRLNAVCTRIVDQLEDHYSRPTTSPAQSDTRSADLRRSEGLQLAALDESHRAASAAGARDEDQARQLPPAAPGR